jgi:hypothetical protein
MFNLLNLNEIERKAFRSTYQDGLWDCYLGLVVVCMSFFIYRPTERYSPTNIFLALAGIFLSYSLFWAGKKFITTPRLGLVRFGTVRKQKKATLAVIMSVIVIIQVGIVGLTSLAWVNPEVGSWVNSMIKTRSLMDLVVAAIGSLFVCPAMILVAYFNDYSRGYYIAILMSLAVFLMISLNQPVYPVIIGGFIILPGLVLLVRFLQKYPLPPEEISHE